MDERQQQEEMEYRAIQALKHAQQGRATADDLALMAYLMGVNWHPNPEEKRK